MRRQSGPLSPESPQSRGRGGGGGRKEGEAGEGRKPAARGRGALREGEVVAPGSVSCHGGLGLHAAGLGGPCAPTQGCLSCWSA